MIAVRPDALAAGVLRTSASVVAAGFGAAARLRGGKPIHPHGAVFGVRLTRSGTPQTPWGARWLDEAGEDTGVARFSRSAGLPHPLPDVLGLALRMQTPTGECDLLLSTCLGLGVRARRTLLPRTDFNSVYSSLLAFRSPTGPVLLAAAPVEERKLPAQLSALPQALARRPATFALLAARPGQSWARIGILGISDVGTGQLDPPLAFDPVLNALPELPFYAPVATLRTAAYSSARQARGASAPELGNVSAAAD